MMVHQQRPKISHDRDMKSDFWIAMPAVAVLQPPLKHPNPADRKAVCQLPVKLLEISAGKIRIEFAKRLFQNEILAAPPRHSSRHRGASSVPVGRFPSIPSIPVAVSAARQRSPHLACRPLKRSSAGIPPEPHAKLLCQMTGLAARSPGRGRIRLRTGCSVET